MLKNILGKDGFIWAIGVVEDRKDPLFLGRCRVRYLYFHNQDKQELPTEDLPWSHPIIQLDNGQNTVGPREGDWIFGFFKDGATAQEPIMVGIIPGIPEIKADPKIGFNDPTLDKDLTADKQPRPPFMSPLPEEGSPEAQSLAAFGNPNQLPDQGTQFGVLAKDFDPNNYLYDVNKDGAYDNKDAALLSFDKNHDGTIGPKENQFIGPVTTEIYPMSRYPLEPLLKEPTTNRYERGEAGDGKIDKGVVASKKSTIDDAATAGHDSSGVGTDADSEAEPMGEPPTPYAAEYPYNHAYFSESGHLLEVDDTPQKERLHQYHRSGTFHEVHPDGTEVFKTIQKRFDFIKKIWTAAALEFVNITAGAVLRLLGVKGVNIEAGGDLNLTVGEGNLNIYVKKQDTNIKITRDAYAKFEGEKIQVLVEGDVQLTVKGDYLTKVKGDYKLDVDGNVMLQSKGTMGLVSTTFISTNDTPFVTGNIFAKRAASLGAVPTLVALPIIKNPDFKEKAGSSITSIQPGFILDQPKAGDLWKPISDSDGKPVSLSEVPGPHILYEAIPTGELEQVAIQYLHEDLSITTWNVVRPVHRKGAVIDVSKTTGMFGTREIHRWNKKASEYPKTVILETGATKAGLGTVAGGWILLITTIRHD